MATLGDCQQSMNQNITTLSQMYKLLSIECNELSHNNCFHVVPEVVDMRWGVRDDATDAHMTTELCLREIKACQEISVGPNFVVSFQNFEDCIYSSLPKVGQDL